jgi:hypothetical protein
MESWQKILLEYTSIAQIKEIGILFKILIESGRGEGTLT